MRSFLVAVSLAAALPAGARTIVVHRGGSIRAAIARASPGDRIVVLPGTYHEGAPKDLNALTITKSDIELVGAGGGREQVVLENAGGQSYGVWVSPADSTGLEAESDDEHPPCGPAQPTGPNRSTLRGFAIHGFTVRGFAKHGVHLACVDGFAITGNHADQNGVYGLFPVVSRHGIVAGNLVTGTMTDAAIYVGQSDGVLIAGNVVHDNELGLEVENSRHCAVLGNQAFGNTLGIFVDILPFLERNTQESTVVAHNRVHDNNRENTATPGDLLSVLPSGLGILVAGGHGTSVVDNSVRDNGFTGIAVVSLCLGFQLQGQDCAAVLKLDPNPIDPNPVNDRIAGNRLANNGTVPQSNPFFDALRADLIWDGSGSGNCWSDNVFATSTPPQLPACAPDAH